MHKKRYGKGNRSHASHESGFKKVDTWLIFAACSLLALVLGYHLDVFTNGFSGSDESSHFVNSYFIWEYLNTGHFSNPMAFAEQFYIAYPKLSLGHWPPLYYTLVGCLFMLFPAVPETAVWINLFVTVLAGFLLAMLLRSVVGFGWSLVIALVFILLPVSLEALNFFMLDQPLVVVVLLSAWVWWRFSYKPSYVMGLLYGALAAAAILIKGNGWFLVLFPMFHILFAQRWGLLRDPRLYAGALLCLLAVVPWYMLTTKISADGFNYSFGIDYASRALAQNLLTLYHNVGPFGLALALFALTRLWCAGDGRKELTALVRIAVSMIAAVLLLHSLIPVDIVNRYMMPAMPFLLLLAILGIVEMGNLAYFETRTGLLHGVQAVALLLLLLPALINLSSATPQRDLRMAEAAEMIVDSQLTQVVVIDGSPAGEGAFIAEALVASSARNLYVVRSSKLLSESNLMGSNYQLLVQTPAEVGAILRNLGARYIVVERLKGGNLFPHSSLMEQFLADPDSGYHKQATLEHRWRPGLTHIYVARQLPEANLQAVQEANFPKKKMF